MQLPRKGLKVIVYQEPIDMRYSFNRLTSFVKDEYSMDYFLEGHIFVFFGRNRHRLKALYFDGSGLILLIKRIEKGRFMWVHDLDKEEINSKEFEQLMHGSDLRKGQLGELPQSKSLSKKAKL